MTGTALAKLDPEKREQIAAAAEAAKTRCEPCPPDALKQRLTLLGMTMSPNRPAAEAKAWLHEFARLLSDIPQDILFPALDEIQRTLKFLPTIAEIREIADPRLNRRKRDFARLDAMRRYLESGQPIPRLEVPKKHVMERPRDDFTADDYAELNDYLEKIGSGFRYRENGERYQVAEVKKQQIGEPLRRNPTRADYIALGIDPAVLDKIEAERSES